MRILHYEMSQLIMSESAVIRARYIPDVRGVNRYKHFHRPLVLETIDPAISNSIDKKPGSADRNYRSKSPRIGSELPPLRSKASQSRTRPAASQGNLSGRASQFSSTSSSGSGRPSSGELRPELESLPQLADGCRAQSVVRVHDSADSGQTRRNGNPASHPIPIIVVKEESLACRRRSHSMHTLPLSSGRKPSKRTGKSKKAEPPRATVTERSVSHIATQTDNLPLITFSHRSSKSAQEVEQQQELLEIIESALDETIDRHSRQRANYFIANSARKQAEVWRNAKDFVMAVLIPQSVQLANKTRTNKCPLDSIGSVQLP